MQHESTYSVLEAIEHMATMIVSKHANVLVEEYRKRPGLKKKIMPVLSHKLRTCIRMELRPESGKHCYPLQMENAPAIAKVEREVFNRIKQGAQASGK